MRREHNELKVGVTVVVVLLLFLAVLVFVGKWDALFAKTWTLRVRFDHRYGIQGLRVDDPVSIGGVNVGRVSSIYHRHDEKTHDLYVYVEADIPENIRIYRDARVSVGTKFVGEGGTLVIMDAGGKDKPLGPGDSVEGAPSSSLADVTEKISQELDAENPVSLAAKIHRSLDNINEISAHLRRETDAKDQDAVIAKVHAALDALSTALQTAQTMLRDARPKVETALTHVETTAKRLDENISAPVARELDRTNEQGLLAKVHASLSAAQTGMENFRELTRTGSTLLAVNREGLQAMIDNLTETSAHLKATAKELRINPWRLLYTPGKPEAEYANLMAAARSFSDAAGALDNANGKLSKLMEMDHLAVTAEDPELLQIREQIKQAFCQFEEAQKKLWELLKSRS